MILFDYTVKNSNSKNDVQVKKDKLQIEAENAAQVREFTSIPVTISSWDIINVCL